MTATVKRLADRGLAVHTPYRGVELTETGRRLAMAVVRRHRIVERFLADMLGYSWSEADRLAPTFEHQLPKEVEDRLFVALDRPATCPHGFPIPGREADNLPEMPSLYDLEAGDRAVVALPGSTDPDVAIFLDGLGVRPGVEVEVREKHPFDGPLVVSVDGKDRTIGEKVARQILVRSTPGRRGCRRSQRQSAQRIHHREHQSGETGEHRMIRASFVASSGDYQLFKLHSTEWAWLIFAAACGLVAIATGFYLVAACWHRTRARPR